MEQLLISIALTMAGSFFLIRNIIHFNNEDKLRKYLETSHKGKLWVKRYGIEKTISLSRKYFLPIGTVMACAFIVVGVWSLSKFI